MLCINSLCPKEILGSGCMLLMKVLSMSLLYWMSELDLQEWAPWYFSVKLAIEGWRLKTSALHRVV